MSADGDEFDAELLAMADGDSSEDEGQVDQTEQIDEILPSPGQVAQSVEKPEDTGVKRGVAQKVRARGRKARRRDDSEENDDAFASEPESLLSEVRARSESVADAPGSPASMEDNDAPLYPLEGKFLSYDDRAWLLSLPELEREQELDKRAQEVIRKQQDLQLKRALASARPKASISKRKASDEFEDTPRKSTRPKVERAAKSALDKYKKAREQAGADKERRDGQRRPRRDRRSASEDSDRDADGESEVEWAEETRRDEPMAELMDFNHCRVGRSNFAVVCFYPGFEEAITGCYARVSVGPDRDTGENLYRMAMIKGFREGKPYTLEGAHGKKFQTDQYAVVTQGRSEKLWPFAACSDSKFTEAELARYINLLRDQNLRVPTRKHVESKVEGIHKLINRRWSDEDISYKIRRQKEIETKYDPTNAGNLAREKIMKRKQRAEEDDDDEEVARCNAELQALDVNSANGNTIRRTVITPLKAAATLEQERLAQRNALTRKTNTEEVRKALLEERRREIKAREKAIADAKAKKLAEQEANSLRVPGSDMADLFGDGSDISRAGTPLNGVKHTEKAKTSRAGTPLSQNGVKRRPLGTLRSNQKLDDDLISAMDLEVDVDI